MIGAVGEQAAMARGGVDQARRADAVGQQAKAAVAAAREAGADLPKNAQGLAASGIARGADPASLFAALVTPVDETGDAGDVGGPTTTPPDAGDVAPVDDGAPIAGDAPGAEGETPVDAAPSAPVAPPPPAVADEGAGDAPETPDAPETGPIVVNAPILSVDDGEVALELLTTASAGEA